MALVCLGGFGKAFCVLNPTYFLLCHAENFNVNKQDHFQDLSYFVFFFFAHKRRLIEMGYLYPYLLGGRLGFVLLFVCGQNCPPFCAGMETLLTLSRHCVRRLQLGSLRENFLCKY